MKKIMILMTMLVLSLALFAGIPHPVFVEYEGEPVSFYAWLGTDSGTMLTDESVGCGILDDYNLIMVECGNFPIWEFADVLYIVLEYADYSNEWYDVILDYDNVQAMLDITWYEGVPGGEVTQQNAFNPGWNLWSYNVQLADHGVDAVFADLTYLTKVKSITQSYDPSLDPQFNTLNALVDGYGYWVQVSQADEMELVGEAIPLTTEIAFSTGWNLAAFLPQAAEGVEFAFETLITGGMLTKVKSITQSYDPSLDPQFNTLATLNPGSGYWVQVNAAVDFMYPAPVRSMDIVEAPVYNWEPVIYTNSTCSYAMIDETYGEIAAFVDGECRGVTAINDGYVSLVINGEEAETVTFKLYQNGMVTDLNTQITTAPGEDVFFEFTTDVPVSTKLVSAYPNPFNPQTTIAYDLAVAGDVNVSVYNIKGQKVAELVNADQAAGQHSVVWNAGSQASGIYFVRFTAGAENQIHKVILMK
jgi:hypothetical protein